MGWWGYAKRKEFRMLHRTELTVSGRVLVECILTERIIDAFDRLVNGVLSTGHINVIDMLGRGQNVARLELLVGRKPNPL
eukprot:6447609-Pyramimonas_sp.AAC.1